MGADAEGSSNSGAAMKRMSPIATALFLMLACQFAVAQGPSRPRAKISHDLANANTSESLDVIVQYKRTPGKANYSHAAKLGGATKAKMHFIRAAAFHVPHNALAQLAEDPD